MINFVLSYTSFMPRIMFLASSLAFMAVYVWSRRSTSFCETAPYALWLTHLQTRTSG